MLVVVGDILVGAGSSEGLLSPECGDRRTVLAVVTLLLLAPLVSTRRALWGQGGRPLRLGRRRAERCLGCCRLAGWLAALPQACTGLPMGSGINYSPARPQAYPHHHRGLRPGGGGHPHLGRRHAAALPAGRIQRPAAPHALVGGLRRRAPPPLPHSAAGLSEHVAPRLCPTAPNAPRSLRSRSCPCALHPARWPSSPTFKSKGFESAVQMVGVLPVLVVAFLCQMSLSHTVRAGREGTAGAGAWACQQLPERRRRHGLTHAGGARAALPGAEAHSAPRLRPCIPPPPPLLRCGTWPTSITNRQSLHRSCSLHLHHPFHPDAGPGLHRGARL